MSNSIWALGAIVKDFRDRFRLSKAKAADILGVSILYVRSLEEGADVKTGLPFKPREATLGQIARKMTEFGYPMTVSRLMDAAGLDVPAPLRLTEQIVDVVNTVKGHYEPEQVVSLINELGDVTYPPDAHERALIQEAESMGLTFGLFSEPGFWNLEPSKRRRFLRDVEGAIEEARELYRLMGKDAPDGA